MEKLYKPVDESELLFLKSLLDAEGIKYFVLNDNFGSMYSGVYMNYFNAKTIMVPGEYYDEAKALIQSAIEDAKFEDESDEDEGGDGGLLYGILDFLTFRWLFPKGGKEKE